MQPCITVQIRNSAAVVYRRRCGMRARSRGSSSCSSRPLSRLACSSSRAESKGCGTSTAVAPATARPNSPARTMKPPAGRIELLAQQHFTCGIEGGEAQPVRMQRQRLVVDGTAGRAARRTRSREDPPVAVDATSRIRLSAGSIASGSIVSGRFPSSPSSTARSVQCPWPVSASEPYSCAPNFAVRSSAPRGLEIARRTRTRRSSGPSCASSRDRGRS